MTNCRNLSHHSSSLRVSKIRTLFKLLVKINCKPWIIRAREKIACRWCHLSSRRGHDQAEGKSWMTRAVDPDRTEIVSCLSGHRLMSPSMQPSMHLQCLGIRPCCSWRNDDRQTSTTDCQPGTFRTNVVDQFFHDRRGWMLESSSSGVEFISYGQEKLVISSICVAICRWRAAPLHVFWLAGDDDWRWWDAERRTNPCIFPELANMYDVFCLYHDPQFKKKMCQLMNPQKKSSIQFQTWTQEMEIVKSNS